jgi:hypothetical protein
VIITSTPGTEPTILAKGSSAAHGTEAQKSGPGAAAEAGAPVAARVRVADGTLAQGAGKSGRAVAEPGAGIRIRQFKYNLSNL